MFETFWVFEPYISSWTGSARNFWTSRMPVDGSFLTPEHERADIAIGGAVDSWLLSKTEWSAVGIALKLLLLVPGNVRGARVFVRHVGDWAPRNAQLATNLEMVEWPGCCMLVLLEWSWCGTEPRLAEGCCRWNGLQRGCCSREWPLLEVAVEEVDETPRPRRPWIEISCTLGKGCVTSIL